MVSRDSILHEEALVGSRARYELFVPHIRALIEAGYKNWFVYFRDGEVTDKDSDLLNLISRNSDDPNFSGNNVWVVAEPDAKLHLHRS